jgi:hypothetical protein
MGVEGDSPGTFRIRHLRVTVDSDYDQTTLDDEARWWREQAEKSYID